MGSLTFKIDEKELLNALDVEMDAIVDEIFADSQQSIIDQGIVDEGTLLNSGTIERGFLNKEIKYNVPYADVIEFGRPIGTMPPIQPIKQWIIRKGVQWRDKNGKLLTPDQMAWAIAKDIKVRGTQPRPFLGPAVESAKRRLK